MCKIISEVGWNHMGDESLIESFVLASRRAGADFCKFQLWSPRRLARGAWDNDGRREIYQKAELTEAKLKRVLSICDEAGIQFMSSVFSEDDAILLRRYKADFVKIPSTEITNEKLLRFCSRNFEEIFLSTGAATLAEVQQALHLLGVTKVTLLHCVSAYPCPIENANIQRISRLQELCEHVGFSDHTEGTVVAKMAVPFKVSCIEKHFTVDRTLPGRDNKFAILEHELKDLVDYISLYMQAIRFHGADYQEIERDARENYRGRWDN